MAFLFSDWEGVTSSGMAFEVFGPATGKAQLPTVDRLTGGTRRRLVPVERSDHLHHHQQQQYSAYNPSGKDKSTIPAFLAGEFQDGHVFTCRIQARFPTDQS